MTKDVDQPSASESTEAQADGIEPVTLQNGTQEKRKGEEVTGQDAHADKNKSWMKEQSLIELLSLNKMYI